MFPQVRQHHRQLQQKNDNAKLKDEVFESSPNHFTRTRIILNETAKHCTHCRRIIIL